MADLEQFLSLAQTLPGLFLWDDSRPLKPELDRLMRVLETRIGRLEADRQSLQDLQELLLDVGLTKINEAIGPVITSLEAQSAVLLDTVSGTLASAQAIYAELLVAYDALEGGAVPAMSVEESVSRVFITQVQRDALPATFATDVQAILAAATAAEIRDLLGILSDIGTNELQDLAVVTAKLANLAVTAGKIADAAVTANKIADEAVTEAKLAPFSVTSGKLQSNAVIERVLANLAVSERTIAAGAVSASKVAAAAVDLTKLGSDVVAQLMPPAVRDQISLMAIQIADLYGTAGTVASVSMVDGIVETFDTTTDVDLTASTGEAHEATSGTMKPASFTEATAYAETFTSNTSQAGYVLSASVNSTTAWQLFDNNTATTWTGALGAPWIQVEFPTPLVISSLTMTNGGGTLINMPEQIELRGSNDGVNFTSLYASASTLTWTSLETKTFTGLSDLLFNRYKYYRIYCNASDGAFILRAVRLLTPTFATMDLRSNAFTARATPTKARLSVDMSFLTGFQAALGSDIVAYASRDGGTTWIAVPLAYVSPRLAIGEVAFTGPTGTSMKWRVVNASGRLIRIAGVALEWR